MNLILTIILCISCVVAKENATLNSTENVTLKSTESVTSRNTENVTPTSTENITLESVKNATVIRTENITLSSKEKSSTEKTTTEVPLGCVCGVFLSGQFKKGSKEPPEGSPALVHEHPDVFPCNYIGNKLCTSKCLDAIVKHLPNSADILCAALDRDCYKERAYLFIKNCKNEWINTNLSSGREYCCKDGTSYKCPY